MVVGRSCGGTPGADAAFTLVVNPSDAVSDPLSDPLSGALSEPLSVHVWSDVACPWCFIGLANLEAGIGRFAERVPDAPPVEVVFRSFELAPDTPVDFEGTEVDFLVRHKGIDAARVGAMLDRVTAVAADAGREIRFDRLQHTNTRLAHELLHVAKAAGVQPPMKERLLRAYFTEGRHVGRIDDLADLAADVGLDPDVVRDALEFGTYRSAVDDDISQARAIGISGVPFFVVDGAFGVSGAHPPSTFEEVLGEAFGARRDVVRSGTPPTAP